MRRLRIMPLLTMAVAIAIPAHAQVQSPTFSRDIVSLFPQAPFQTCLIGQFEPPPPSDPPSPVSAPHVWVVRAEAPGALTVNVAAVSVNPSESGAIVAGFDGGPTIVVPHPVGVMGEASGLLNQSVVAGGIYLLVVRRQDPPPGSLPAHHYRLTFEGAPVDVGLASPSFRYFEAHHPDNPAIYHLNVAAGEGIDFRFFTDPDGFNFGANQATQAAIRLERRSDLGLIGEFSGPSQIQLPNPFGGAAGTVVVRVSTDGHYRLENRASDPGLYVDTCAPPVQPPPPPPPPPPGSARTIGYWKNHEADAASRLPVHLGNYLVDSLEKATAVLDWAHAKNAYEMLAAQLLAAKLNVNSNVPFACVQGAINDPPPTGATGLLVQANYLGPRTTSAPTGATKAAVNEVKDLLDAFNNNGCP